MSPFRSVQPVNSPGYYLSAFPRVAETGIDEIKKQNKTPPSYK